MSHGWPTSRLTSEDAVLSTLLELHGRRWLCRGQDGRFDGLIPSLDRETKGQSRLERLGCERQCIEVFRANARHFVDAGEELSLHDDLVALMVLRHYSVPTRLLDWTTSLHVAAYFACQDADGDDGELWCFDHDRYAAEGAKQWERWPETLVPDDPTKFDFSRTAFLVEEPPDWFVCEFYPPGFPRQRAQNGFYSATARFERDHANAIEELLGDPRFCQLYTIDAALKTSMRGRLREEWGIWHGALYPDSAGAARTAASTFMEEI